MPKFLAGFALGVILTIAAYGFLDGDSREEPEPEDGLVESGEAAASGAVAEASQHRSNVEPEKDRATRNLPLEKSVLNPMETISPLASGSANPSTPESTVERTEKRDYSNYPPEITAMLDTKNPNPLQSRYEAEEKEDSWAAYMEGQLAAYFAQKPELAQFNISRIDCRSSVCEIQAIGYGLDARATWTTATADIIQQPWHDFKQMSMSSRDPDPGIFAVVLVLARKPQ